MTQPLALHLDLPALVRARSKHLSRCPAKLAEPEPSDHWPPCAHAIRYAAGMRRGQLVRLSNGEVSCLCECRDRTGRHRWEHEDLTGDGRCFWCSEPM